MTDPAATGARVLAGLAKGRTRAHERAREIRAHNEIRVRREYDADILRGRSPRGRPMRIARAVGLSESGVRKILSRLFNGADSPS